MGTLSGSSIALIIHSFDRSLISRLRDLLSHSLFSRLRDLLSHSLFSRLIPSKIQNIY